MSVLQAWAGYQPRYAAYGLARGAATPEALYAMDTEEGRHSNFRFILWVDAQWREWCRLNGVERRAPKSAADHEAFDAWLAIEEQEARAAALV